MEYRLVFSSRSRHTRFDCDWSSDVCSSDLAAVLAALAVGALALIQWASDGRALASFRAVASGGARPGYALGAPLWFLLVALQDPVFLSIVAVAALYAAALRSEEHTSELQSQSNL